MSNRFFVNGKIENTISLTGEEYSHAVKTLRVKVGEEIVVFNGENCEYRAIINEINKNSLLASVIDKKVSLCEPKHRVALLCGFLKGDKTELVVREAVELGVSEIAIFNSQFVSAYMSENKLERLNKVSIEASKQCGRTTIVPVKYFDTFEKVVKAYSSYSQKFMACEFDNGKREKLQATSSEVAIIVGSEGGFSQQEANLAIQNGYTTIGLGNRILRADTAGTVCLSIIMYNLGELQ